jgi:hypothetical protein
MKFSIRRARTPRIEGNKAAASRRTPVNLARSRCRAAATKSEIETAAEDAERFAIGRPPEIAATPFGRLPDFTGLRDIFSQGVRVRMGGMTSS